MREEAAWGCRECTAGRITKHGGHYACLRTVGTRKYLSNAFVSGTYEAHRENTIAPGSCRA